jgi:hypothetical protein
MRAIAAKSTIATALESRIIAGLQQLVTQS